jgi:hypothetical protein
MQQLSSLAELHDNMYVVTVLIHSLKLNTVQAALEPGQHSNLPPQCLHMTSTLLL